MFNALPGIKEIKEMNTEILERLDLLVAKLDILIELTRDVRNK